MDLVEDDGRVGEVLEGVVAERHVERPGRRGVVAEVRGDELVVDGRVAVLGAELLEVDGVVVDRHGAAGADLVRHEEHRAVARAVLDEVAAGEVDAAGPEQVEAFAGDGQDHVAVVAVAELPAVEGVVQLEQQVEVAAERDGGVAVVEQPPDLTPQRPVVDRGGDGGLGVAQAVPERVRDRAADDLLERRRRPLPVDLRGGGRRGHALKLPQDRRPFQRILRRPVPAGRWGSGACRGRR